ncbi:MAG: polysaccharide deacetylase family protein, partial [Candidatus Nanoarchaeia archaeon]
TFDDGYIWQYNAAKLLENYGWRGTFYISAGLVGKEFENISLMSKEQIHELYKKGHEIGSHTYSHINASEVSVEEYEQDVLRGKEVAGIVTENFAFPHGDDSKKEIVLKYYKTARGVKNPCINNFSSKELCGVILVSTNDNYKDLRQHLDKLKANGGWLILVIHNIDENPRLNIDLTEKQLTWVLDQVNQSGIPVKTIAEVLSDVETKT